MNDKTNSKNHWSFWVIAAIALIWNVLGGANFMMQMNADLVATLPETHRAIIIGRPLWATGGFALSVFGGALGCLLLLFRKSAAHYLFVVSLLGTIVTMIHTARIAILTIDFSLFELIVMIVLPLMVTAFLLWYSRLAMLKSWIK